MQVSTIDAQVAMLRGRADGLLSAARRVEALWWEGVLLLAGEDTWRGPVAQGCRDDLRLVVSHRDAAATALRASAIRLEAEAQRLREEQLRAGLRS